MTVNTLTCPTCGKVGTVTHGWQRPGVASGTLMTGLDPQHCEGCWDILSSHGYAPTIFDTMPDGPMRQRSVDRPRSNSD